MDISSLFMQNEMAFYGLRAVVLAAALCLLAIALGRWRRSGRRDMQRLFDELDQSRGETRQLSGMAEQLSGQIRALQARFEDRQQLAAASVSGSQRGYDLALQMARNGAKPEEIISASGVTRHEAALLTRLHNPSPRQA